ncbi:hypothetical protein KAS41_02215, partial [Candidatus Parcubacteria bacterium]|nr:hypothetical protein [Candidatus Parcubacteria bacterium]
MAKIKMDQQTIINIEAFVKRRINTNEIPYTCKCILIFPQIFDCTGCPFAFRHPPCAISAISIKIIIIAREKVRYLLI